MAGAVQKHVQFGVYNACRGPTCAPCRDVHPRVHGDLRDLAKGKDSLIFYPRWILDGRVHAFKNC